MFLIGDVHGKFGPYKKLIRDSKHSIQLGDMGVGFVRPDYHRWTEHDSDTKYAINPPFDYMVRGNHRFIRGNHDNPGVCKRHKQWIADGTYDETMKAMMVGGAFSIDHMFRTRDIDWWADEELSYDEADKALTTFLEKKPEIMLTHDCPLEVIPWMHSHHFKDNSFTQRYLQNMFEQHQPRLWVYGHHHKSFEMKINGTTFRCLNELETMDL
jgi:hypothetical protein